MSVDQRARSRIADTLRQPLVFDSGVQFMTILLQALGVAVFWVIAARLHEVATVGIAGSLVAAVIALSHYAQLGLNTTLLKVLPVSSRPGGDIGAAVAVVGAFGFVLGLGYALVVPAVAPGLAFLAESPWRVLTFATLTSATSVNLLTDSVFLGLRALPANLVVNGVVMGAARLVLPFALVGFGAFGLFLAMGLSTLLGAALSVAVIAGRLPRRAGWLRPSRQLVETRRLAGASYLTSVIDEVPILVLPLVILHALGASSYGVYFVCLQIGMLMYSAVYVIGNTMFAEVSRHPHRMRSTSRRAALIMAVTTCAALVVTLPWSTLLLSLFGPDYADQGEHVLQVFTLGVAGVAFNYWSLMRLRLFGHLLRMVLVQLASTAVIVALAVLAVGQGVEWVAAAYGIGCAVGGALGWLCTRDSSIDTPPDPATALAPSSTVDAA